MRSRSVTNALAAGLMLAGCLYDPDDRCGSDERHLEGRVCVCNEGTLELNGRCEPVPPATGGLGARCASNGECGDPAYPVCRVAAGVDGYCTVGGCHGDTDCPSTYFCVRDAAPTFCARYPTGQGKSCASSDDCKGLDASFCGVGDPRGATCWVPNCTDLSCAPGFMCFDVGPYLPGAPKVCVQ